MDSEVKELKQKPKVKKKKFCFYLKLFHKLSLIWSIKILNNLMIRIIN